MHEFDPGPVAEPFASLARGYPGAGVYPADAFRVEWGPIFHRGRLDGSARLLILGQDPGQHESVARRILVGEAGQRVQGFLRKLRLTRSYVMVNAFLYSVYGQAGGERHSGDPAIVDYRNRWFDALLAGGQVEAVVGFGRLARDAFERWLQTSGGHAYAGAFEPLTHPTMPEASSGGNEEKRAQATRRMLEQWNAALGRLDGALGERDIDGVLEPYGDDLAPEDRSPIPDYDLPAGAPPWMSSVKQWAQRKAVGAGPGEEEQVEAKRATIVVTVPLGERPWH